MGTISEKLTYLNGTKQKLKQAINNIGGEVTDETTFREYVEELQDIYDNLPKTEYQEGTEVNLGKTIKGKLDYENGIVGIGQTEQDSTQGYQLMNLPTFSQTQKGIKVEYINGVIKINGTASESGWVFFTSHEVASVESGQTYTYSLSSNKTATALQFFLGCEPGAFEREPTFGSFDLSSTNPNRTKVMSASGSLKFMVFGNITSGTTYNLEVKPMLEKGSTAHEWEKYTGGQASPNPSYPQEIKYVRGKNRLDDSNLVLFNSNKYISTTNYSTQGKIAVKPNTTYTLAYKTSTLNDMGMWEFDSSNNKSTISYTPKGAGYYSIRIFTTLSTTKTISFYAGSNDTYTSIENFLNAKELMILEGDYSSQAIPSYLPYNTIEEVVSGINYANYSLLFNNTDCYSISDDNISLLQNDSRATSLIDGTTWGISLEKGTYTLYTSGTGISPQIQIIGKTIGQITRVNYNQLVTFELSQDDIVAIKYLNTSTFPINLGKVMIIKGTITNTPTYEPYITPKTYQFSLGDHKFYGIGDYKDELVYDVDEDKVYKKANIRTKVWNGSEDNWGQYVSNPNGFYNNTIMNVASGFDGYCNYFVFEKSSTAWTYVGKCGFGPTHVFWLIHTDTSIDTIEKFKTWLSTHNVVVIYISAEPVLTEITDTTLKAQVKAWYYGQSLDGTTIIEGNGDLPMIIKCRGLKGE